MNQKEQLRNAILSEMTNHLTAVQLNMLDNVLNSHFKDIDRIIIKESELPAVCSENNQKLVGYFLVAKQVEGRSHNTLKAYLQTINELLTMIDKDIQDIDSDTIRYYLYQCKQRGNNETTLNNKRSNLNSFFSWLLANEYIERNPIVKVGPIKRPAVIKKPFSDEEIVRLKEATSTSRDIAIIDLLVSTGVRVSELCNIKLSDVDFANKQMIVHGKGNKDRIVYLQNPCIYHINKYLSERSNLGIKSDYLFTHTIKHDRSKPLTKESIEHVLKHCAERSGVDNVHPHRFRRTFCTNMLINSDILTVQTLMGHNDISTTRIYATVDEGKMRSDYNKLKVV